MALTNPGTISLKLQTAEEFTEEETKPAMGDWKRRIETKNFITTQPSHSERTG